jgi:hypothetical protein
MRGKGCFSASAGCWWCKLMGKRRRQPFCCKSHWRRMQSKSCADFPGSSQNTRAVHDHLVGAPEQRQRHSDASAFAVLRFRVPFKNSSNATMNGAALAERNCSSSRGSFLKCRQEEPLGSELRCRIAGLFPQPA